MNKTKKIILLISAVLLGLLIIAYGLVFDPFSLPFQDYEQLSDEVKRFYENKSVQMDWIKLLGLAISLTSIIMLVVVARKKSP
jgi:hypothetical protein